MKMKNIALLGTMFLLPACSTVAAADKTGEKVDNVVACETSACLKVLRTAEVVDEKQLANGDTEYLFRIQRRQGSYLRALAYGGAAVMTLGLSEVAFTPLEGALQNENQMAVEAVCDANDQCHRMVIAQLKKPKIFVRGATPEEEAAIAAGEAELKEAK